MTKAIVTELLGASIGVVCLGDAMINRIAVISGPIIILVFASGDIVGVVGGVLVGEGEFDGRVLTGESRWMERPKPEW